MVASPYSEIGNNYNREVVGGVIIKKEVICNEKGISFIIGYGFCIGV